MVGWRNTVVTQTLVEILTKSFATLNRADDIGHVIEFLSRESLRPTARAALRRLFPLVNSENAYLISPSQYAILYKELFECDADFVMATLDLLAAVRDPLAVHPVARLAAGAGIAKRDMRVRAAAKACLVILGHAVDV